MRHFPIAAALFHPELMEDEYVGAELGGLRGLALYSQRVAVQGDRPLLDAMLGK